MSHHDLPVARRLAHALLLLGCLLAPGCGGGSSGGGGPPPLPPNTLLPVAVVTVKEGTTQVAIRITRENPAAGVITVDYATADGSALADEDYVPASGTLTWDEKDNDPKVISITIKDDPWFEGTEQFRVAFTNAQGGAVGNPGTTVFILDDETAPPSSTFTQRQIYDLGAATSFAATGDVDGDQVVDLVIGDAAAGNGAGRAEVRSGRSGKLLYSYTGTGTLGLGEEVAGLGDTDNDGTPDFGVTVPGGDTWSVRVYSGKDGTLLRTLQGTVQGSWRGTKVAAAGDVNEDGNADVVVGLPRTAPAAGSAEVYSGKDGALLFTARSLKTDPSFGAAVAPAGDVNADKADDVLVGAPAEDGTGVVYVLSGKDGSTIRRVLGKAQGSAFGTALGNVGDRNNDGVPDFIVGAPDGVAVPGESMVVSGRDGRIFRTFTGERPGARHGASVASAGDFNRDGNTDFVVGEPGKGSERGVVRVFDGQRSDQLARFVAPSGESFGRRVAAAGDVNDDRYAEVLLGNSLRVVLLSGKPLSLVNDVHEVSVSKGGDVTLLLDAGDAGISRRYMILGSFGTTPGIDIGGFHLPLNSDSWFNLSLNLPNVQGFQAMRGSFDVEGRVRAILKFPATQAPSAVGVTIFHAFLAHDDKGKFYFVSNAAPLNFVQ